MERSKFQRAVRYGLGRTILYLRAHPTSAYNDIILDACLNNDVFDQQINGDRGWYLHQIITATGDRAWFRAQLVAHITDPALAELDFFGVIANILMRFARDGDDAARNALYTVLDRNPMLDTLGKAIVEMDGLPGLLLVAERVGMRVTPDTIDDIPDDAWHEATSQFGRDRAWALIEAAAAENAAVARYLDWLKRDHDSPYGPRCAFEPYAPYAAYKQSIEDYLARKSTSKRPFGFPMSARAWTRYATEDDLLQAAEDVLALSIEDSARLDFYLRPFMYRRFPVHHQRLIELADSTNERVVMWTLNALGEISHPDVRALGLRLRADGGERRGSWMGLLVNNLQPGDHELFEESIRTESSEEALHSYGFVVHEVIEERGRQDFEDLLILLYDRDPCGNCRERFVKLLQKRDELPHWIIEESRFDANDYLREFVNEIAPGG